MTINKAIMAFVTSAVGLLVTFGVLDEATSQAISGAIMAIVNVILVYWVPNAGGEA